MHQLAYLWNVMAPLVLWLFATAICRGTSELVCSGRGTLDLEWDDCFCFHGYAGESCDECALGFVGWPKCHQPAYIEGVAESNWMAPAWARLCNEVAGLRANSPSFVAKLGDLYEARQTTLPSGTLYIRNDTARAFWGTDEITCSGHGGDGPWRLKVDLASPPSAPAALNKHHRVVLVFDKRWPYALPDIRFAGKIRTGYTLSADDHHIRGMRLHTAGPNGLLRQRLVEAAGGSVQCMWRQTGACAKDGSNREPERDLLCNFQVPMGSSGFCDCNGDGVKSAEEEGFGCSDTPSSCAEVCSGSSTNSSNRATNDSLTEYSLKGLLQILFTALGAPLHDEDALIWRRAADEFSEEASTAVAYEERGRRHPHLFRIDGFTPQNSIDPQLLDLIKSAVDERTRASARAMLLNSNLIKEVVPGLVFSFRVFTDTFCQLLMEEIRHFYSSKLPARRPNSMNNYGIILNDIGLEPLIFNLQDAVIQPLASVLLETEGSELESHHAFTIRYRGGEDTHLDVHTDDSDVTFNVNIQSKYTGAPLVFCGLNGAPDHRLFQTAYQHELGHAVLHLGRHRHGAEDITSGERMNLVVWSYSHDYRSSTSSQTNFQREDRVPDARCVSYTHDRDFEQFRAFPPGKRQLFLGRGWCPRRGTEYPGFKPDVPDTYTSSPQRGQCPN